MTFRTWPALLLATLTPAVVCAQPLGTFKWQLQPYCNVVSVVVTQTGGVFALDGFDDQCGAATRAPLTGLATPNPDGTIEFGLAIVTTRGAVVADAAAGAAPAIARPHAVPLHVAAAISLATLGGTWHDSTGAEGSFVFTPGLGAGGSPRPMLASGVAPGSVGSTQIDATQVQRRVSDSCSSGSFMQGIGETGSVECDAEVGDISSVVPGAGLAGGGSGGAVSLSIAKTASGAFNLSNAAGILSTGSGGPTGPGIRFFWNPGKSAIRAGGVSGTQWDDANIGLNSVAMGADVVASGNHAVAFGSLANASGAQSVAIGQGLSAAAHGSVVLGTNALTSAGAIGSFVFGDRSGAGPVSSIGPNNFVVRAAGGVWLYTKGDLSTGALLPENGSQWLQLSDVRAKEHFRELDDEELLRKIADMPVHEWSYKAQGPLIRHVGPTAQDFHAAFGLGEDPLRIGTLDEAGVALAAVKALEARTREQREENAMLRKENDALKAALVALRGRLERLEVTQQ